MVPGLAASSCFRLGRLGRVCPCGGIGCASFPSLVASLVVGNGGVPLRMDNLGRCVLFFKAMSGCGKISLLISTCYGLAYGSLGLIVTNENFSVRARGRGVVQVGHFVRSRRITCLFGGTGFVICPCHSTAVSKMLSLTCCFGGGMLTSAVPFFRSGTALGIILFGIGSVSSLREGVGSLVFNGGLDMSPADCLGVCNRNALVGDC